MDIKNGPIEVVKLPKADLHVHLNGAVPTVIIRQILHENRVELPLEFDLMNDLQILTPVNSLVEYFKPWSAFKKIPIGFICLQKMVDSALRSLSEDNVKYVELRNSPFYIGRLNDITLEESLGWLIESIDVSSQIYRIDARVILSLTRHELNLSETEELLKAIKKVNRKNIIVGVDLSGDEDCIIPNVEVADFFRKAKDDHGLGITIHAGETGNFENILWAIEDCKADRIGHGLAAVNSTRVLYQLKERNICTEVSLVSNVRTGYIDNIENHPLKTFLEWDIPFVLCTDNPSVHNVPLSGEYNLFLQHYERFDIIEQMYQKQMYYSFCKGAKKFEEAD